MRPDLLALSPDDLATMANRGLVKRAQKEVELPELIAEWDEKEDGTIRAKWSDQVTATIPGGKTLKDSSCTCGSVELCRHVLRTVLAWQKRQKRQQPSDDEENLDETQPNEQQAWDPGSISEALLNAQVPKAVQDKAAILWTQGVLVELHRSAKPTAQFHFPGHTVRLLVPYDLRYANCSCPDPAPCVHVALAVKAFQQLAPEKATGLVSQGTLVSVVNPSPLKAAEIAIRDLLQIGLASMNSTWRDRVRRIAEECLDASLVWPANILDEIAADFEKYDSRDSTFDPMELVKRLGEFLLRSDAIISGKGPVPQPFLRGMKSDREAELGSMRLVGLGADIQEGRSSTTVTVYLQDSDTGHAMTVSREFNEDISKSAHANSNSIKSAQPPGPPVPEIVRKPFRDLARATAVKSSNLAQLAAGQLLSQGGKRTAGGRLVIGRARAVVNPQNYHWERLKAPVLVEDFSELRARLLFLPPASFRPRRVGADFHVCPVAYVEEAVFDPRTNSIRAHLKDRTEGDTLLIHPWTERGHLGAEALLNGLKPEGKPLFIAGHFRLAGAHLIVYPTAYVFSSGEGRRIILPWLDSAPVATETVEPADLAIRRAVNSRYQAADDLMCRLLLNGLNRSKNEGWPTLLATARELEQRGYHQISSLLHKLTVSADPSGTELTLLKMLALARDLG